MAGTFSDYTEDEVLDHILGVGSFTMPTVYLALCTGDPTDAGDGASMNEVPDSNAYARVAVAANFGTPASGGSITNDSAIGFVEATGSWGEVTHYALVDSGTHGAGNMLAHSDLAVPKTIDDGDTPSFDTGDIVVTLD